MEVLVASSQECPHRACPFIDVAFLSLTGVVGQECAVETGVCVLHQFYLGSPDKREPEAFKTPLSKPGHRL